MRERSGEAELHDAGEVRDAEADVNIRLDVGDQTSRLPGSKATRQAGLSGDESKSNRTSSTLGYARNFTSSELTCSA